jgi:DNA repair photolyase
MSLRLYTGEYLVSPIPVHFGLNWCTHACRYCFANLNRPERRADNNDLAKLVKWARDRKGPLEWWYLARGYPLLVANDSDPFARSNVDTFRELHRIAGEIGIRLAYQTKGGDPEAQAIALDGRPTLFYVSLTSDDDRLLADIEPGAPPWQARLDLIRAATARGHHVVVGLNPLLPAWWRDIDEALDAMIDAGARHLWHGELHLSRFQIAAMPDSQRLRYATLVDYGRKRKKPDAEAFDTILRLAVAKGFNCFDGVAGSARGFWQPYFDLGFPFMPTLDGLFRDLEAQGGGQPVAFSFDAFDRWADTGSPGGYAVHKEYLSGFGRSLRNDGIDQKATTRRQVHEWYWRWLDYPTPLRTRELHVAVANIGRDDQQILVDDDDRPIMIFTPRGSDEVAFDASLATWIESINPATERR